MRRMFITAWALTIVYLLYLTWGFYMKTDLAIAYKYGSRGQTVIEIQTRLKKWGYYNGSIDGIYGYQTYTAVKYFQRKNGLYPDGITGDRTLAALGINVRSQAAASSYSGNTYLLARAIHGEARGEPYIGQVAVGGVILNRVSDPRFPSSIAGVIYQPGAFTAVSDGQIDLPPGQSSLNSARDALNGWDPSGGALYYYNPAKTTNKWIWSRPIIKVIGAHYFCK